MPRKKFQNARANVIIGKPDKRTRSVLGISEFFGITFVDFKINKNRNPAP
jgi:hypothetical protein